jgi:3-dehydroquinate synthase
VSGTLRVIGSDFEYPILFQGAGSSASLDSDLGRLGVSAVLVDGALLAAHPERFAGLLERLPYLALAGGEGTKSVETLGAVWEWLARERIGRDGVLAVIGGGVLGDLGGFAAATYLRGIACVQVPTTLLAMVDSSVGGKTGLNLQAGKNLAGAFHHPQAVLIHPGWLGTLPAREFAAGAAEVLKYGLLGDAALFSRLEQTPLTPGHPELAAVIRRCCELKAGVVAADPRELAPSGGRALLNLGHTFGHAIEQVAGYGAYLHGEAVAVGLCAAARLSRDLGLLDAAAVARVDAAVAAHGLPPRLVAPLPLDALLAAMARDKKVRAGRLRFVVLEALGRAATRDDIDPARAAAVWREMGAA